MADYQSAQGLSASTLELYAGPKTRAPPESKAAMDDLATALKQLKTAIDNTTSVYDVEVMVRGSVRPNLQKMFNLKSCHSSRSRGNL